MVTPQQTPQGPTSGPLIQAPSTIVPDTSAVGKQTAQLGTAMTQTGLQVMRLTTAMQEDVDQARYQAASSRYADKLADHEKQFGQLTGLDVEHAMGETQDVLRKERDAISKGLTSDRQRRLFGLDADARDRNAGTRMFNHSADQLKIGRTSQLTAGLNRAAKDRIDAGIRGDGKAYVLHSLEAATKLKQLGELSSFSKEEEEEAATRMESRVVSEILNGLLSDGALKRAETTFETNKSSLDPKQRASFKKLIKEQVDTRDAILLGTELGNGAVNSLDVRRGAADKLRQGKITGSQYKTAVTEGQQLLRDRDLARAAKTTDLMDQATSFANASRPLPPSLYQEMIDLDIYEDWDIARRQNPKNETTAAGERFLFLVHSNPSMLDRFDSPEQIYTMYHGVLDQKDLNSVATHWKKRLEDRFDTVATEIETGTRGAGRQNAGSKRFTNNPGSRVTFGANELSLSEQIMLAMKDLAPDETVPGSIFGERAKQKGENLKNWDAFARIRRQAVGRVNDIMIRDGLQKPTQEAIDEAISNSLPRVGAPDASFKDRFYYGLPGNKMKPLRFGDQSVSLQGVPGYEPGATRDVDNLTFDPTQISVLHQDGADSKAQAQARHNRAADELVAASMVRLAGGPTAITEMTLEEQANLRARAELSVTEPQVIEFMAYEFERAKAAQEEVDRRLSRKDPMSASSALARYTNTVGLPVMDPDEQVLNDAMLQTRTMWSSFASLSGVHGGSDSETDAELFVESYREFEDMFRGNLNTAYDGMSHRMEGASVTHSASFQPGSENTGYYKGAYMIAGVLFPETSDSLRRSMAEAAVTGDVGSFRAKIAGMVQQSAPDKGYVNLRKKYDAHFKKGADIRQPKPANWKKDRGPVPLVGQESYSKEFKHWRMELFNLENQLREAEGKDPIILGENASNMFPAKDPSWWERFTVDMDTKGVDVKSLYYKGSGWPAQVQLPREMVDLLSTEKSVKLRASRN